MYYFFLILFFSLFFVVKNLDSTSSNFSGKKGRRLSVPLNCISSRVKATQSSRDQMFPSMFHFTQRKFGIEFLKDKRLFSSRRKKKRRKENDSHPFGTQWETVQTGPKISAGRADTPIIRDRRKRNKETAKGTGARIGGKKSRGRNNRSHSTPWYISIHKYTLCTFSKPRLSGWERKPFSRIELLTIPEIEL